MEGSQFLLNTWKKILWIGNTQEHKNKYKEIIAFLRFDNQRVLCHDNNIYPALMGVDDVTVQWWHMVNKIDPRDLPPNVNKSKQGCWFYKDVDKINIYCCCFHKSSTFLLEVEMAAPKPILE